MSAPRLPNQWDSASEFETSTATSTATATANHRRRHSHNKMLLLSVALLGAAHLYLASAPGAQCSPALARRSSSFGGDANTGGRIHHRRATSSSGSSLEELASQLRRHQTQEEPANSKVADFDPAPHQTVFQAIKAHADLQQFAKLCEATGIQHVMSLAMEPLTVFAPTDQALGHLLAEAAAAAARISRISLEQLAKSHVVHDLTEPLDKLAPGHALTFTAKSRLPLYANRRPSDGALFINNARKLATYHIGSSAAAELQHTLHIIDQPLLGPLLLGARAPTLEALLQAPEQASSSALEEFAMRSTDFLLLAAASNQSLLEAHLQQPRVFARNKGHTQPQQVPGGAAKVALARNQLELGQLKQALQQAQPAAPLNTYFVPLNSGRLSEALGQLAAGGPEQLSQWARALCLPGQVLFTRTMELGRGFATGAGAGFGSLALIKSLPLGAPLPGPEQLLAEPLLVEARCPTGGHCKPGFTQAELVLANVPLANGVLHFIREPLFVATQNLREYLEDEEQLESVFQSLGSSSSTPAGRALANPLTVHKFRRLLEQLAEYPNPISDYLSKQGGLSMSLLVPSDQAFQALRYDVRALLEPGADQQEAQALIERLVKHHFILHQPVLSDQMVAAGPAGLTELNLLASQLHFQVGPDGQPTVSLAGAQSPEPRAHLLQRDLLTSQGVVHVIDRVLGEPQETLHSLLEWNQLRASKSTSGEDLIQTLEQLVANQQLKLQQQSPPPTPPTSPVAATGSGSNTRQPQEEHHQLEHLAVSQALEQYLEELEASKRHEPLASSLNISYLLGQLPASASNSNANSNLGAWNERFKDLSASLTYFIPSDLGWLRALRAQPALFRPLAAALAGAGRPAEVLQELSPEAGSSSSSNRLEQQQQQSSALNRSPFLRILERHLVSNEKIHANQLESLNWFTGADLSRVQLVAAEAPFSEHKSLRIHASLAHILQSQAAANGYLYLLDNVLVAPEDADAESLSEKPTSSAFSLSAATQNLLGEYLRSWLPPLTYHASLGTVLLIGALGLCILVLLLVALVLASTRLYRKKSSSLRELEVSASSSEADASSPSITKNL